MLLNLALSLHSLLFIGLTAVCAFDDGRVAPDWTDCMIPLALVLLPLVLATLGKLRRIDGFVMAAAISAALFAVVSITGPGLFLLLPALLYGVSLVARKQSTKESHPGPDIRRST